MSKNRHQIVANLKADADRTGMAGELRNYESIVKECQRNFGRWDVCDPVVWAIVRVVQAQNDFAHAIEETIASRSDDRIFEEAAEERIKATAALQRAIEKGPHGPGD
jgi:hypothetical protein